MCVSCHPIYSGRLIRGGTSRGHTGSLRLPSAVLALIFIARRIEPFLSLVDREVEFCQTFVSTRVLVVSPTFVYSTLFVLVIVPVT